MKTTEDFEQMLSFVGCDTPRDRRIAATFFLRGLSDHASTYLREQLQKIADGTEDAEGAEDEAPQSARAGSHQDDAIDPLQLHALGGEWIRWTGGVWHYLSSEKTHETLCGWGVRPHARANMEGAREIAGPVGACDRCWSLRMVAGAR